MLSEILDEDVLTKMSPAGACEQKTLLDPISSNDLVRISTAGDEIQCYFTVGTATILCCLELQKLLFPPLVEVI
jgi:hypothetical protein